MHLLLLLLPLVFAQRLKWDPKGIDVRLTNLSTTVNISGNTVRTQLDIDFSNPTGKAGGGDLRI